MDPISVALFTILLTIISYVFYQAWSVNKTFERKGVPHIKPWLFIGNAGPLLLMRKSQGERQKEICNHFPDEPVIGYYEFMRPQLLVNDAEITELIIIKDFMHFTDHGIPVDEKRNPFESNLFTMTGKRWKAVRNKLSPIFTTGKLKMMYNSMADCGDELQKQMEKVGEVEMRELLGRFAMDVIGSCAFGIEPKNLAQENNQFRIMGKKSFEFGFVQFLKFMLFINFPSLVKALNLTFNKKDVVQYFTGIIKNTIKYRRENNFKRNDFVQMLIQLQDKGYVEMHTKDPADDYLGIDNNSYTLEKFEMSDDQLTGQAFIFLTAGFEATTISMTYTLYELCKHKDIQDKVRKEILEQYKEFGTLSYDTLRDMTYLEQCIKETMRKYPPAPALFRVCTKEFIFPNGLAVKPGDQLLISLTALHHNPKYYPEPEKYKPERFDPDQTLPSCAYLPFGNGPRICIAMRFAMLEMKYCLAKLLMNYEFSINPKTVEPLTYSTKTFFTSPKQPIIFDVKKIKA